MQAAIHYPGHQSLDRAWRHLDRRSLWYFGALGVSAGLMVLLAGRVPGAVYGQLQVMTLLAAVFGGYFWLAAPVRLPPLYDEHELCFFADGPFRMNMAGVRFHNGNWPPSASDAAALELSGTGGDAAGALDACPGGCRSRCCWWAG